MINIVLFRTVGIYMTSFVSPCLSVSWEVSFHNICSFKILATAIIISLIILRPMEPQFAKKRPPGPSCQSDMTRMPCMFLSHGVTSLSFRLFFSLLVLYMQCNLKIEDKCSTNAIPMVLGFCS